jgi:tetratricopeptide (TPR) repeat protein
MLRKTLIALLVLLTGCNMMPHHETTVGQLNADNAPIGDLPLPKVTHKDVRNDYRELLKIVEDKELGEQIERRIAGVYMLEGDHKLLVGNPPPKDGYFAPAIKSYNEVVKKYPETPDNSESLYQLAKAYDLDGKEKKALEALDRFIKHYRESPRLGEVYFRKGDILFRQGRYEEAEDVYKSVISLGQESTFLNNSYYLLGWTEYKQSKYDDSIESFARVLDRMVPENGKVEQLNKVEKSLVDDTLHIMSLSLAYAGGAQKLKSFFSGRLQSDKYSWLLYAGLGKHFLNKERFEDSAASFRVFVMQNPTSDRAPEMHSEMIRSYVKGEFSSQVLPEKEQYVMNYGIDSEFWRTKGSDIKAKVMPNLKSYLDELARHYHAKGQKLKSQLSENDPTSKRYASLESNEKESFLKAANYYGQYMKTFPRDPKVAEMVYMRAESYFDGGNYVGAIGDYLMTAYDYKNQKYGSDAGYAAIIAFQKQAEVLREKFGDESQQVQKWRSKSVDNQLRFVESYPNDKRSSAVLAKTAEELFALKRYEKALEIATGIVNGQGKIDEKLNNTAYGVIALSQYQLGNYAEAEGGYRNQLKYLKKESKEYGEVVERLATAIYKQGESAVQAGDLESAIQQFIRIKKVAPLSNARVVAQFDAATHMMELELWDSAIPELIELRKIFPQHKLIKDISTKIAYAYEQDEQWTKAAEEYMEIYRKAIKDDVKRDALFIAAELYEKAGDYDISIGYFKRWAHTYEEPFDNRMEARYHLSYLYKKKNDMTRHLYWLRRIIDGDKKAGDKRTERSKWLAAQANAEYGDYWSWEFKRIRLRAPLEKWIPIKNEKLKNALDRYKKAAQYGIHEVSARAFYSIGFLYERFAKELMNSPRPRGLSKLELEQYEVILEEQAMPFEDLAIEIHQSNIQNAWDGNYNNWVGNSFVSMAKLSPARFDKEEHKVSYGDGIR